MSLQEWSVNAFGLKVSSKKEVTETIYSLKPGETKIVRVGKTMKIITLSNDGKISIVSNEKEGTKKEIIELW